MLRRTFPLLTAIWLQFAPMMARLEPVVATLAQPIALMLRWLACGTAMSGAFHAVSGATGITITAASGAIPASGTIPATNGVSFSARFSISTGYGIPKTYTYANLPPGLTPVASKPDTLQGKPTQAGNFITRVTGWEKSNASGHSAAFSVKFLVKGVPPAITQQPTNLTVSTGGKATFTVAATGTDPLSYQWTFQDLSISSTTPTLTLTNVTAAAAGKYRVQVNSSAGSVWSDYAVLTVLAPPPVVSSDLVDQTVLVGAAVNLTVGVTGVGPFSYAWLKNGVEIGGAAVGSTLAISAAALTDAGTYQARISGAGGPTLSRVMNLTVNPLPLPIIVTQPLDQKAGVGSTASFSVVATGVAPLQYMWLKDGQDLGGSATNATLTLASVAVTDAGQYRVRVHTPGGDLLSDFALLTVALPPAITAQTGNLKVFSGEAIRLSVTVSATSGSPAPVVTWQKDGADVPGANANSLIIDPVSAASAGTYRATVSGSGGVTLSDPMLVELVPVPVLSVVPETAGLRLHFATAGGREYRVESRSAVDAPWQAEQTLQPIAATTEAVVLYTGESRFYRLQVVPLP